MEEKVLTVVKQRLGRMPSDTSLDEYLTARVGAAIEKMLRRGIHVQDTVGDIVLLADVVVWEYGNRDKSGMMPDWLRHEIRNRWISEEGDGL